MTWNPQALLARARALEPQVIAWRRDIHMYPELGFEEERTAALVVSTLCSLRCRVRTEVGGTGVVASLGEGHPAIGLRADMDALPITEANEVPYASRVPGVMHACGHDAHVAMLLGAAQMLAEMNERPAGEVRLLFQPSEERLGADGKTGALRMVEAGALQGLDAVVALHVDSGAPSGRLGVAQGYASANGDYFEATIAGVGGHDSSPHDAVDPIQIAALVINAIHSIRSRRIDPLQPATVSIGAIHGGERGNIIPSQVQLKGTLRSFSEEVRGRLVEELEKALGIARALDGDYALTIKRGVPSVRNDPVVAEALRSTALETLGPDALYPLQPRLYVEDFSYMARQVPGTLAMLGARIGAEARLPHNPHFDLDESALHAGVAVLVGTACRLLGDLAQQ